MASGEFYRAWYRRTRDWVDRYLPGMARRLHAQARGEAGGRTSPVARHLGVEKMALLALTPERVRDLSREELLSLHRRCHQLAGALARKEG